MNFNVNFNDNPFNKYVDKNLWRTQRREYSNLIYSGEKFGGVKEGKNYFKRGYIQQLWGDRFHPISIFPF